METDANRAQRGKMVGSFNEGLRKRQTASGAGRSLVSKNGAVWQSGSFSRKKGGRRLPHLRGGPTVDEVWTKECVMFVPGVRLLIAILECTA